MQPSQQMMREPVGRFIDCREDQRQVQEQSRDHGWSGFSDMRG
jgi:hypothetical protein